MEMARVLVLETYRESGMKFQEAIDELNGRLAEAGGTSAQKRKKATPKPADNDASMAMLQSIMGGSDFGGPKG